MRKWLAVARWLLVTLWACGFLLYLNGVVANLWLAGGPPTDAPQYYLWRAWRFVGICIALLALIGMTFALVRPERSRGRQIAGAVFAAIAVLAYTTPRMLHWVQVDRCLDSSGSWNDYTDACERQAA